MSQDATQSRNPLVRVLGLSLFVFLPFAAAAEETLPVVLWGGEATVYVDLDVIPMGLSTDPEDTVYVGNNLLGGSQSGDPAYILRVPPGGGTALECSELIRDPDAVLVDSHGYFARARSVLVGGIQTAPAMGRLTAIRPSCGPCSIAVDSTPCLSNPYFMAFDPRGRLFVSNWNPPDLNTVCYWENGGFNEFIPPTTGPASFVITSNSVFVAVAGVIARYSLDGQVLDPAFGSGSVHAAVPLVFREEILISRADSLFALDLESRAETLLLYGAAAVPYSYCFLSDGSFLTCQSDPMRILRIAFPLWPSAVGEAPERPTLLTVLPNPACGRVCFSWTGVPGACSELAICILDVRGGVVRRGLAHLEGDEQNSWTWVIDSDTGTPSGTYFVLARCGNTHQVARFSMVR